jgi:hypothetical protein
MIVARDCGRAPEEMITICTLGKRFPRRRPPKAPTEAVTIMMATVVAMTAETLAMTTLSGCIRCVVRLAVTPSRSSTHWSTNVSRPWRLRQHMEDLERMVEDDYKFLNRNVRKLFGMVGNMKGKWCNSCGKYH